MTDFLFYVFVGAVIVIFAMNLLSMGDSTDTNDYGGK